MTGGQASQVGRRALLGLALTPCLGLVRKVEAATTPKWTRLGDAELAPPAFRGVDLIVVHYHSIYIETRVLRTSAKGAKVGALRPTDAAWEPVRTALSDLEYSERLVSPISVDAPKIDWTLMNWALDLYAQGPPTHQPGLAGRLLFHAATARTAGQDK